MRWMKKFPFIHRVPPVLRFTKRKIPFLPPKFPIRARVLNISLIFLENLKGMGWGKNFPKSIGSPCSLSYGQSDDLMDVENFSFIVPYPSSTFLRKIFKVLGWG